MGRNHAACHFLMTVQSKNDTGGSKTIELPTLEHSEGSHRLVGKLHSVPQTDTFRIRKKKTQKKQTQRVREQNSLRGGGVVRGEAA